MAEVAVQSGSMAAEDSKWWVPLVMGIVSILFGLLMLSHPAETSVWIAWLVGVYWFIGGVMNLVLMFVDRTQWGWKLALGILGIFAGLLVLDAMGQAPLLTTVGLASVYVWVLGIQGIVYGIIELIQAFQGAGWGIGFLGVISILFGTFLVFNPFPASLALPLVFAVIAIVGGIAAVVMAFKLKSA
ncbi:MAG TPA: DUF308 domain-containing protein [Coriobacteriia bacterium]|nr:DUF308 domain-containing protein [Coriobacteriia bacterium]